MEKLRELPQEGDRILAVKDAGGRIEVRRARVERVVIASNGTLHPAIALAVTTTGELLCTFNLATESITWCRGWDEAQRDVLEAAYRLAA